MFILIETGIYVKSVFPLEAEKMPLLFQPLNLFPVQVYALRALAMMEVDCTCDPDNEHISPGNETLKFIKPTLPMSLIRIASLRNLAVAETTWM